MTELNGALEAYWEQGWEGRIEFAFTFEGNNGPFFLESGQHLTIYDESDDVLWSGRIKFVRKNNWFDKHKMDARIWSWVKQKGVPYSDWMSWFWHKPPLKAKLIVDEHITEHTDHAHVKIHPPVLLLFHVLAAFLLNWLLPWPIAVPKLLEWTGYILVFVGLGFSFSAVSQFGKVNTTLDPHGSVSAIVMSGPYRFSRNPIYFGFLCTLVGLPLVLGNYWGAILSPVFMVSMFLLVIKHEEAYLDEKFKDVYTSYKSRVRRWL